MLFSSTKRYKGQKYNKLKQECASKGTLFVDPEFPANGRSLYYSRSPPGDIVWKRPGEIVSDPKFFLDGASADDFSQGTLGNCWFVAACACIAEDSKFWKKVVPDYLDQEWTKDNTYAGIFHFKFWRLGQWYDVVIDDYLPTRYGQLIYLHSRKRNEFWSALLEKAYAKLFGDYESLSGGKARDAMVDMTGGVGEGLNISDFKTIDDRDRLFDILEEACENHSLMSSSIIAQSAADMEKSLNCGLVKGHAYSVTMVKNIRLGTHLFSLFNKEKLKMIRLRNPWGGTEWRGAWSDGSSEWKKVSESQKKDLGLTFDENGEFWMAFEDFLSYFNQVDICHVINTSIFSLRKTWTEGSWNGEWKTPNRAGGCPNYDTFLRNPQFLVDIKESESEIQISLEQEDMRVDQDKGKNNEVIGCFVMKTDLNRKYRMHDRLEKVHSSTYSDSRNMFSRVKLEQGRYCIIPSTFNPRREAKFLLRVYGNYDLNFREAVNEVPPPPMCCGVRSNSATQISIKKGDGLKVEGKAADPYCFIKCEGKELSTPVCKKTESPEWNTRVTFYRKKPDMDIIIEVWDKNMLADTFIGTVTIPMSEKSQYKGGDYIKRYPLYGRGQESEVRQEGGIWLKIKHTADMEDV